MRLPFQASDEQVMWRVQAEADAAAFAELVRRWEQPIQRLCARMIGDLHRAEDLSQEAFARVFAKRGEFHQAGRFSTWLWRIALNLCQDELRRRTRRGEVQLGGAAVEEDSTGIAASAEPADAGRSPDEAVAALEQAELVRRAVLSLPEHYRTVLVLRHYEGLRFGEIAEVLGIPEGTVKSRMAEGLSQLAGRLGSNLN